ncbi:MAG: EAL domain-containing response regulator [Gammaproteobacteria bacterium]
MSNGRLLILDDDADVGRTIERIAKAAGLEARWTDDAPEFFQAFDTWLPTHIALDLIMPDMDGVEVMVKLAQRQCRARIIISSGVGSRVLDAAGRSAAEHGLDIAGVLSKPFAAQTLRDLLAAPGPAPAPPAPAPARRDPQVHFAPTVTDVERALHEREFVVFYQPKVDCSSGSLAGFEALVRWRHPEHGLILPDRFIALAEQYGLIDQLTEQVFDEALLWFAETFHTVEVGAATGAAVQPTAPVVLSVNISARTLRDQAFVERLLDHCVERDIHPERIIFELTETSAMEDPIASLDLLTRLRMKGFQLSIDDFGTGYSSMLQLVRLPFSEIKVDKSFVMTATRSIESRTVVRSIIELGHSLGLRATAEGVEDAETLAYLKSIECDLAQGFLIGRPMSSDDARRWSPTVRV